MNENGIEVSQSESFLTGKEKMAKKSAPRFGRYTQILIIEKRSWYRPLSLIITNIMSTQSLLKTDNFRLLFFPVTIPVSGLNCIIRRWHVNDVTRLATSIANCSEPVNYKSVNFVLLFNQNLVWQPRLEDV